MANLTGDIPKISISDIINLEPIKQILNVTLTIAAVILIIWLIFKFISAIKSGRVNRRIFKTYDNTEEIKKRLDSIDKKLDKVVGKKKLKK